MSSDRHSAPGHAAGDLRPVVSVRRGAKALVSTPSRVLLVRERHADGRPFWTLPGGGAWPGEPLIDALHRELDEELGCAVVGDTPVSEFWYAHLSSPMTVSVYTVFDCAVATDIEPARGEGIFESRWVDPDTPPARTLLQVRCLLRDYDP